MTGPHPKDELDVSLSRLSFQDAAQWAYLERWRQGVDWHIHSVSETKKKVL
jgi:aromatic ring-cleaving dioxygenase